MKDKVGNVFVGHDEVECKFKGYSKCNFFYEGILDGYTLKITVGGTSSIMEDDYNLIEKLGGLVDSEMVVELDDTNKIIYVTED